MLDHTEFKKKGNYYSVICRNITADVKIRIERFCREKISSGDDPSTGIVVSCENGISYMTLYETANGQMSSVSPFECEYMLEF